MEISADTFFYFVQSAHVAGGKSGNSPYLSKYEKKGVWEINEDIMVMQYYASGYWRSVGPAL